MRIAVVTGASSGMGREFVYAIDREFGFGARRSQQVDEIWVIARRTEKLEELKAECSTPVRAISLDLTKNESFGVYKAMLEAEKPEIKILVNAAGVGLFGTFAEMDMEKQLEIIDLNDKALTAFCHISIPYMPEDSHILNLASNSSWQPVPYIGVYGASKAYVMSFSRALGVELKSKKIHVMAVAPGWIKTEFFGHAVHDDTIKYYDRLYTAEQVIERAMKDMKKRKPVSILGFPVRMQVRGVKLMPVKMTMKIWCKQQGK